MNLALIASSREMSFSRNMSIAILAPANPVRLPSRVWSIHNLPCCTVNSMSCTLR